MADYCYQFHHLTPYDNHLTIKTTEFIPVTDNMRERQQVPRLQTEGWM